MSDYDTASIHKTGYIIHLLVRFMFIFICLLVTIFVCLFVVVVIVYIYFILPSVCVRARVLVVWFRVFCLYFRVRASVYSSK